MNGVLNLDKPAGMTSHDVVAVVRKLYGQKRVGHTGTLDPLATGVLVLCMGKATRIAQYLEAGEKEYRAEMKLGVTTDTYDADGRIISVKDYTAPALSDIVRAAMHFIGEIEQTPPAYSAVKVGGIPSYRLAREGRPAALKARKVKIFAIEVLDYHNPLVTLQVRCSKGVYIRTLCKEIGDLLGMGAHLNGLERLRSGLFTREKSISLDRLRELAANGMAEQALIPTDEALSFLPLVALTDRQSERIRFGNEVFISETSSIEQNSMVRIHDQEGMLIALGRLSDSVLKPSVVF